MRLPTSSAIALISWSSIVVAQQADIVRVRGTIESSDQQLLSVQTRDGERLKVRLAPNAPVRAVVKAPLSDNGLLCWHYCHATA